jgi:hypothetical protein
VEETDVTDIDEKIRPEPPRPRRYRWVALVVVGLVLVIAAGMGVNTVVHACGGLGSGVTEIDGECVGVTDGSYVFHEAYREVQERIAAENKRVDGIVNDPAQSPNRAVTVALLNPMTVTETSAFALDEVRNLLEGAYTAQHRANNGRFVEDPDPLIRLMLANEGSNQEQWQPVVDQLVEMKDADAPLNAVVGLGNSLRLTELAAKKLSVEHGIPTIGAIVTADQLNYTNIPGFVRVAPSNQDYVRSIRAYLQRRPELDSAILVYDSNSGALGDIFVESFRDDLTREFGDLIQFADQSFVGKSIPSDANPSLFAGITTNICAVMPKVVFFAGRKVDLRDFLNSLGSRTCRDTPLTVVTVEADPDVIGGDVALRNQKITVVYADATDPRGWVAGAVGTPQNFPAFRQAFENLGFPVEHLYDGGAISYHDAVLTAVKASRIVARQRLDPPGAADVHSQLLNLNTAFPVPGASGTLSFGDRNVRPGDPAGKPVPVLEVPASDGSSAADGEVFITGES